MRGAIRRHQSEEGGNQTSSGPPVSLISPRKEAAIANALAAAAAAAVAGGNAHGNATRRPCCRLRNRRAPSLWEPQMPSMDPSMHPIGTAVTASVAATAASHVATAAAAAAAVATAACDSLAALELPQRCPRWRPQIAAAVPTMAPVGSTETSMRGLPISAPISPPQGKPRVVAPAAATPLAAAVAVKGVGHLPLRDDLSAPAAAASAALDASSAALGSGSRAAAAPQRAAAAPIDPVRQRVRQRGTR